jgi:translocator protein
MSAVAPPPVQLSSSATSKVARDHVDHRPHEDAPRHRSRSFLGALAAFGAASALAAGIGSAVMRPKAFGWYRALKKPSFTPPDQVFGVVWPALYTMSSASAARVWQRRQAPRAKTALGLWGAQLGFNAAWTPLFFGARRPKAAFADLLATAGALAGYTAAARRVDRKAAWLMAPYLGWLAFAGLINATIIRQNRGVRGWLLTRG